MGNGAEGFEGRRKGVRSAGAIEVHAEGLTAFDLFHSSGYILDAFDSAGDRHEIDVPRDSERGGFEAVVNMLFADDLGAHGGGVCSRDDVEGLFSLLSFDGGSGDGACGRLNSDGEDGLFDEMKSGVGNAIVDVANRDTVELEVIEDVKLSVSIRFDGAVIIEMIASNIREARGVEGEARGSIFGECFPSRWTTIFPICAPALPI